jgi:hypothetical protein
MKFRFIISCIRFLFFNYCISFLQVILKCLLQKIKSSFFFFFFFFLREKSSKNLLNMHCFPNRIWILSSPLRTGEYPVDGQDLFLEIIRPSMRHLSH